MFVFKGENREVVITISTDTVIRRCLLPWRMRYKSQSADPPLVQQLVDRDKRHTDREGEEEEKMEDTEYVHTTALHSLIPKPWGLRVELRFWSLQLQGFSPIQAQEHW